MECDPGDLTKRDRRKYQRTPLIAASHWLARKYTDYEGFSDESARGACYFWDVLHHPSVDDFERAAISSAEVDSVVAF